MTHIIPKGKESEHNVKWSNVNWADIRADVKQSDICDCGPLANKEKKTVRHRPKK